MAMLSIANFRQNQRVSYVFLWFFRKLSINFSSFSRNTSQGLLSEEPIKRAQNHRPNSVEVAKTAQPHGPTGVKRPHCVNVAWGWRWLCERFLLRGHPDRLKLLKRRRPETDLSDLVQLIFWSREKLNINFSWEKGWKRGILDSHCLILGDQFDPFYHWPPRRKTGSGASLVAS